VYSDLETLHAVADAFDFSWGASWVRLNHPLQQAPVGRFDPSTPPPWSVWQFCGATIGGVSVDCNSASDDFQLAAYTA
jgi:hypothetical protein